MQERENACGAGDTTYPFTKRIFTQVVSVPFAVTNTTPLRTSFLMKIGSLLPIGKEIA
jgi:hypothetical protein